MSMARHFFDEIQFTEGGGL